MFIKDVLILFKTIYEYSAFCHFTYKVGYRYQYDLIKYNSWTFLLFRIQSQWFLKAINSTIIRFKVTK